MKVPFLELLPSYVGLRGELDAAYHRVMDSGWYLLGQELEQFEKEYAIFCGVKHCIGVANGLDALYLSLKAMGVGAGDEVIVPSNTYIATWLAVSMAGAVPVPVEPDPRTYNIDPTRIEAAITSRTRVVFPVHLYGQSAEMSAVNNIARRHGLYVLEDNAQAQGALFQGRTTGGLGDAAGNSFYPSKNLGAFADAGAITTNSDEIADKVRVLRNYGSRRKYYHEVQGINSRMDELQAAFLRCKLTHLPGWNDRRARIAAYYRGELAKVSAEDSTGLLLPHVHPDCQSVWHVFILHHPRRDEFQRRLAAAGVGSLAFYPVPPHRSSAYADESARRGWANGFPIAERLAETCFAIPNGPYLSDSQVEYVASAVGAVLAGIESGNPRQS